MEIHTKMKTWYKKVAIAINSESIQVLYRRLKFSKHAALWRPPAAVRQWPLLTRFISHTPGYSGCAIPSVPHSPTRHIILHLARAADAVFGG